MRNKERRRHLWQNRLEGQNEMVRQSRFVIMRMYNNFHLTFSKNQNIIKNERVANERKSSFCYSFFYFYNHKMSLKSV
nr:MAG TPA: hypothetical protein [Caudoviricetes sp.]